MIPKVGDRVIVTSIMPNDPNPIEVGAEGTVRRIGPKLPYGPRQIDVAWDCGRTLFLLETDPFMVVKR